MLDATVESDGRIRFVDDEDEERQWGSLAELANDYLAYLRLPDRVRDAADTAAWDCVHDLVGGPAWSHSVELIDALLVAARDERDVYGVAAGPLWELVTDPEEGPRFVDAVETRARQDPRWRQAVARVWLDRDGDEVVNRRLAVFDSRYPDGSRPS